MLAFLGKTAIIAAIPKLVDELGNAITAFFTDSPPEPPKRKKISYVRPHKKHDCTPYTKFTYDFIVHAHTEWKAWNIAHPSKKKHMDDLIRVINDKTGMDKGRTSLAKIWNKKLDRESLQDGEHYFDY